MSIAIKSQQMLSPQISVQNLLSPFKNRHEKRIFRNVFPLPVLSVKSKTETFDQESSTTKISSKIFNPHFKLKKMHQLLNRPIVKRTQEFQKSEKSIESSSKERLHRKISFNQEIHQYRANYSILRSKVLSHARKNQRKESPLANRSKMLNRSKLNKRQVKNNEEAISNRESPAQNIFLKCYSLSTDISPRKISRNLVTVQVKNQFFQRRPLKGEPNEVSGWQSKIRQYDLDFDPTGSIDVYQK